MDSSVSQILILLVLLLLSGIFSSAETALTTYNKIRMRALADEGNKRASAVLAVTENSGKMLSAILIGNNIVNTAVASLATTIAYRLGGTAVAIASGLMTLLISFSERLLRRRWQPFMLRRCLFSTHRLSIFL